ncbi:MAG: TlpA disulfide reductase family protein [Tissierellaceae bacterium]|nr:TlpA disulfide reductase family protein [Tissierellaceae bacterium]
MKKILIMILIVSIFVTGCATTNNNNTNNDTNNNTDNINNNDTDKPDTVIDDPVVDTSKSDIAIGVELPDFTLENLEGEEVSLSDFRGKIVLVNFWASWCYWCDVEMPDLNKLSNENDDLVVLAVNVKEDKETARKYIEEKGLDFEVVLDTDGKIATQYMIEGLPNSYFVDEEGIFMGRIPGAMNYDQMIEIVNAIRDM